ncbi:hypothetical protein [Magnetospirillum molischianum]|uniref:Uncharacterized protein n=1 Tax=Magnetospirillum molischianum DSM 120 TaxID=1150626 RepID=H8FX71_MAGML|nr:hypothetical protein [Magnetospirillum molischianum]CCG42959.1 conserved hypothetical protein [Magnetospirillum molischianum DSM 120]
MTQFRTPGADELERRFDGPVLPADPALTGRPMAAARGVLFQRLAAEQRQAIARRRIGLSAVAVRTDERLCAAGRSLYYYRNQGAAWIGQV